MLKKDTKNKILLKSTALQIANNQIETAEHLCFLLLLTLPNDNQDTLLNKLLVKSLPFHVQRLMYFSLINRNMLR